MSLRNLILVFGFAISIAACNDGHLRGKVTNSSDGKTYFGIIDNNGGKCGPIKVDGKVWAHALGEVTPISDGEHTIECGSSITFSVPAGVVFKFDYWGP